MWDDRYKNEEYAYGVIANTFLQQHVSSLPNGTILSLAEGEGRNAVFLAKQGYTVTAVDSSMVGLKKAEKLAKEQGVSIELIHADLDTFDLGNQQWDGIISIFCPLPSALRKIIHEKVCFGLKQNGVFLLEAYTPKQVEFGTGGGSDIDTMQTKKTIIEELNPFHFSYLEEVERDVVEGIYHTGPASVVQAIGTKQN